MKFNLHRPQTLDQAIDLAAMHAGRFRYIAGGTDLVVQMRRGLRSHAEIIDLSSMTELRCVKKDAGSYQIGALCTHKEIESHPGLISDFPALCKAARVVGGHQVRNIGTVGGNIANASPAADVAVALLGIGGIVNVRGKDGSRSISLDNFFLGPGETVLKESEIITSVTIPVPANRKAISYQCDFVKIGRRKAMEIAVASAAILMAFDADGRVLVSRIALGAVGPKPLRAAKAEAALQGAELNEHVIASAAELAGNADCAPRTDVRASDKYRRKVVQGCVSRMLAAMAAKI